MCIFLDSYVNTNKTLISMILIIFDKMGDKLTLNLDSYGEQTVTSDDHHDELMVSSNCTLGIAGHIA